MICYVTLDDSPIPENHPALQAAMSAFMAFHNPADINRVNESDEVMNSDGEEYEDD